MKLFQHKIERITVLVLFITIAILLGLRQCSEPNKEDNSSKVIKTSIDSTMKSDSVKPPDTVVIFKTKWYPKVETITRIDTLINPYLCQYRRIYNDTLNDSNLTIYSNINTIGLLESNSVSYKLKIPIIINNTKTITLTNTIETIKPNKSELFINTEIGGNMNQFDISMGLGLKYKKAYYGYRYSLLEKTHSLTIGIRLYNSKK